MWAVVVDDADLSIIPQDDDPIATVTHQVRSHWLAEEIDPNAHVTGYIEAFDCPVCTKQVSIEMPNPTSAT